MSEVENNHSEINIPSNSLLLRVTATSNYRPHTFYLSLDHFCIFLSHKTWQCGILVPLLQDQPAAPCGRAES